MYASPKENIRAVASTLLGVANFRELRQREARRIYLLRSWVSKDHYARLRFFVNEEHALAKVVRCGSEAGLGAQVLRPTLFELLVCVGKLAGRECLTSAGSHYYARRHG